MGEDLNTVEARAKWLEGKLSIHDLDSARENLQAFVRTDAWQNLATSLGVEGKDHRLSSKFKRGREIPRQEYEAMYIEDPIFARIVDAVPEHGTRRWIKVTAVDKKDEDGGTEVENDFSQDVMDALEDLDAQQKFFELWRLARLDGGAAMVLAADDGQDPEEPLDLSRVKTLSALNVVTRFEIFPTDIDEDITSPTFRQPLFYGFTGKASARSAALEQAPKSSREQFASGQRTAPGLAHLTGSQRIHHSRVIRMRGIILSESLDRTQGTALLEDFNWGTPIIQRVFDDLRQYNTIFSHVEAGFKDMSQGVFGMKNLAELLAVSDSNEKLIKRMTLIGLAASTFNMVLFDPDFESYEKRSAQFSGIDNVLKRFMEKLGGAAEIPLTKLFGMTPAGLSTDDAAGERTFNSSISTKQRRKLRNPINRVVEILLNAKEGPTGGIVPEQWRVQFVPLDEPNETEDSQRRKVDAETDALHLLNGTLELHEVRTRVRNDPDSPYTLDARVDEAMEAAAEPMDPGEAAELGAGLGLPTPDPEVTPEPLPPGVEGGSGHDPELDSAHKDPEKKKKPEGHRRG